MRIAFCCMEWEPVAGGGIRTYVEGVTRWLGRLGQDAHVITFAYQGAADRPTGDPPTGDPPTGDRAAGNRLTVHRVGFTAAQKLLYRAALLVGFGGIAFHLFYSLQVARKVRELARAGAIDIVESPDYAAEGLVLTFLQRRFRSWRVVPHVVMLHTPSFVLHQINGTSRGPLGWLYAAKENWNIRRAPHLSSPSHALSRRVTRGLGLDKPIFYDPYPSDLVKDVPADPGAVAESNDGEVDGGAVNLLYVGRLEHRKGVTFLIDALNQLCPKHPELRAELVGGDTRTGPGRTSMRRHLEDRLAPALRERVCFVDRVPREELFPRYRSASFCVFPSVFENFANTCLEAIAFGCVVVVPRDSGMAEMIRDKETGFLFTNCDTGDLCRVLEECLGQRHRWAEMGRSGRELIAERFEPAALVLRKLEHYESLRA